MDRTLALAPQLRSKRNQHAPRQSHTSGERVETKELLVINLYAPAFDGVVDRYLVGSEIPSPST